ncbi:serine/threonine protein kinase [Myxococcaceae bacterium GXIMD 01537]
MAWNGTRAFACVALLCLSSGCRTSQGSVALRADGTPGPEECPEEALKTMRILRIRVGDSADVELDINQIDEPQITLYDGPVESYLDTSLGALEVGTRLYGRVWTQGRMVVVRYYEARPVDGDTIRICAVVRGLKKRPESIPTTALLDFSNASAYVVDSFR